MFGSNVFIFTGISLYCLFEIFDSHSFNVASPFPLLCGRQGLTAPTNRLFVFFIFLGVYFSLFSSPFFRTQVEQYNTSLAPPGSVLSLGRRHHFSCLGQKAKRSFEWLLQIPILVNFRGQGSSRIGEQLKASHTDGYG